MPHAPPGTAAMRIVADTNTVLSGLLWQGPPRRLLDLARERRVSLYTSVTLLAEPAEVIASRCKLWSGQQSILLGSAVPMPIIDVAYCVWSARASSRTEFRACVRRTAAVPEPRPSLAQAKRRSRRHHSGTAGEKPCGLDGDIWVSCCSRNTRRSAIVSVGSVAVLSTPTSCEATDLPAGSKPFVLDDPAVAYPIQAAAIAVCG